MRRLLHSEAILVILSEMTGVILHPLAGAKQEEGEEAAAEKEKKEEVCVPSIHQKSINPLAFRRLRRVRAPVTLNSLASLTPYLKSINPQS